MTKKELQQKQIGVISLGCDKNRVDTEHVLGLLTQYGFKITNNIEEANIIIINTCSFILDARTESMEAILESINYKTSKCEKVIVMGCLTQMGISEIKADFPEIDAFVKLKENKDIVDIIEGLYGLNTGFKPLNLPPNRIVSTPKHYAYLKIADGCNNACAYCTIPAIRGRFKSEPIEVLVEEAKALVAKGVKELILVAQDTTRYGLDLYKKPKLVELIKELSKIDGLKWIRLHYCYPEMVSDELIDEVANNKKVCKYIDIPLQHISDKVLKAMNRRSSKESIETLINKIRSKNKDITIRSTFIVGFPGETRKDYKQLYNFLNDYKLNYVGFFPYSREPKTAAYNMKKQVPTFIKMHRLNKLQKLQESVLLQHNEAQIGKECIVLCNDYLSEQNYYVGRSEHTSAEVDTLILFKSSKPLKIGEFYTVKITNLMGYDLEGEVL
ncbi:MAG: 30S ribosomal protein S12 methylthiotransferase RimO [Spirochaetales bacterium]